jgi:biotin synthase
MDTKFIIDLGERVLGGYEISREEALLLAAVSEQDIPLLGAYANKIRARFAGKAVDMCGVVNARSGMCSEDCKFCSQSAHYEASTPVFPLKDKEELLDTFRFLASQGAARASIVTSGKGMEGDKDYDTILQILAELARLPSIRICANIGTITEEQALDITNSGVTRYAHNLETSERFYPNICSTHPYSERYNTLLAAKKAGMELCSGGIIGLGETWEDRVDMALTLRELDVSSIPINIQNPIPGTPLEHQKPLSPLEIIQTFAVFRFILPDKIIRPAGGREINLRDMQGALMLAGANGLIIGNYLTFIGRDIAADFTMVNDAGLLPSK